MDYVKWHFDEKDAKEAERNEREKDVKEILWCAECQVEFLPEDFGRHPKPAHVVSVWHRCLTCGNDYESHDSAFNCCAPMGIKL